MHCITNPIRREEYIFNVLSNFFLYCTVNIFITMYSSWYEYILRSLSVCKHILTSPASVHVFYMMNMMYVVVILLNASVFASLLNIWLSRCYCCLYDNDFFFDLFTLKTYIYYAMYNIKVVAAWDLLWILIVLKAFFSLWRLVAMQATSILARL